MYFIQYIKIVVSYTNSCSKIKRIYYLNFQLLFSRQLRSNEPLI